MNLKGEKGTIRDDLRCLEMSLDEARGLEIDRDESRSFIARCSDIHGKDKY